MEITQSGDEIHIDIDGLTYDGRGYDSTKDANKGTAGAEFCGNDGDAFSVEFSEVVEFKVKTDPATGAAKVRGLSTFQDSSGVGKCRLKFERTTTADPVVADCN